MLTDILLGIIEESAGYRQILGFDKGDTETVNTGGKKVAEVLREVTDKFLVRIKEDGTVTLPVDDFAVTSASVKNRISK